ncbi:Mitochondrial nuclease [Zancudomyces culisetae]|uniref:Endonuclease n=1 Tax=Zancudomyces culisetae TaxID=1213189 RepID=A0A1R1PQK8_ZANCU|nr:Mitochondrial nuclease [Zancudomyces culisetae]|eukprot:OMH83244.1 Mitochondrial nuclease [Zancudomyces culisetae]
MVAKSMLYFGGSFALGGLTAFIAMRSNKQRPITAQDNSINKTPLVVPSPISKPGLDSVVPPVPIQKPMIQQQQNQVATKNTAAGALKFGYPGPINDNGVREGYAYSYNRLFKNPNWIAEHLTKEKLFGDGNRKDIQFKEDHSIPKRFRALLSDYFRSGYDRGHMAPAADCKVSQNAMEETFYLTNISPQVGDGFNRHYWAFFESFVRDLTKSYDDVYVVTGPLYLPKLDPETKKWYVKYQVIGNPPNVAVPTHFYKVVMGTKNNDKNHYLQAFVLPNTPIRNEEKLESFIMPLDALERASGLEFFTSLDKSSSPIVDLCKHTVCQVKVDKRYLKGLQKPEELPAPK